MTKEKLAEFINGRQYGSETTTDICVMAKESGLLICYGSSDDILSLDGFITDEASMYGGGTSVLFKHKGQVFAENVERIDDFEDPYKEVSALDAVKAGTVIKVEWCPDGLDCSWLITTSMPHASFDIMEDGELFCRGVVIDLGAVFGLNSEFEHIKNVVAGEYGQEPANLFVRTRRLEVKEPRQVIQSLCKFLCNFTLARTGAMTGGYDHATTIHSIRTVQGLYFSDRYFRGRMDNIFRKLSVPSEKVRSFGFVTRGGKS